MGAANTLPDYSEDHHRLIRHIQNRKWDKVQGLLQSSNQRRTRRAIQKCLEPPLEMNPLDLLILFADDQQPLDIIQRLLELYPKLTSFRYDADVTCEYPIHHLCHAPTRHPNFEEFALLLLKCDGRPEPVASKENFLGDCPLRILCRGFSHSFSGISCDKVVEALCLAAPDEIDSQDSHGVTPLDLACFWGNCSNNVLDTLVLGKEYYHRKKKEMKKGENKLVATTTTRRRRQQRSSNKKNQDPLEQNPGTIGAATIQSDTVHEEELRLLLLQSQIVDAAWEAMVRSRSNHRYMGYGIRTVERLVKRAHELHDGLGGEDGPRLGQVHEWLAATKSALKQNPVLQLADDAMDHEGA